MNLFRKRNVLSEDDPLFRRVRPVILDIACNGIILTPRRTIVGVAVFTLLTEPFVWLIDVVLKGVHTLLILGLWLLFRDELSDIGLSPLTTLSLGLVAVYYRTIYLAILSILQHFLVVATVGGVVHWVCRGYLANAPLRQSLFEDSNVQTWIPIMAAVMPVPYQQAYDRYMDLYLDSNDESKEKELIELLDSYEPGLL